VREPFPTRLSLPSGVAATVEERGGAGGGGASGTASSSGGGGGRWQQHRFRGWAIGVVDGGSDSGH
jgi:hypothetical protein